MQALRFRRHVHPRQLAVSRPQVCPRTRFENDDVGVVHDETFERDVHEKRKQTQRLVEKTIDDLNSGVLDMKVYEDKQLELTKKMWENLDEEETSLPSKNTRKCGRRKWLIDSEKRQKQIQTSASLRPPVTCTLNSTRSKSTVSKPVQR